jgi:1-deoxy-D-xylulose-5-phosphate reductoisomerase
MRRVSVFGVTGSIGESTFDLLMRQGGAARYRTVALTAGRNVARLAEQARALQAELAVIADERLLPDLRAALAGTTTECAAGMRAVVEAA